MNRYDILGVLIYYESDVVVSKESKILDALNVALVDRDAAWDAARQRLDGTHCSTVSDVLKAITNFVLGKGFREADERVNLLLVTLSNEVIK